MDIVFASDKLRDLLNDDKQLKKKYGTDGAKRIRQRLYDLSAADNLEVVRGLPGHCEELTGDRKGQLSMRLHGGHRLIFAPTNEPIPTKPDGGLDWQQVTAIMILGVEDYHR